MFPDPLAPVGFAPSLEMKLMVEQLEARAGRLFYCVGIFVHVLKKTLNVMLPIFNGVNDINVCESALQVADV